MLVWADRVRETSTTTGTGPLTVNGAPVGYRTFASQLATGDTCYGFIAHQTLGEWEVVRFTMQAGGTLARSYVDEDGNSLPTSAGSGVAVSFSVGTKDVMLDVPAFFVSKVVRDTRAITTAARLTGGGNLSADRTIDLATLSPSPAGSYVFSSITVNAYGQVTAATSGSASPGGSTKQVQFNSGGSFGGAAGIEYQSGASPNVLIVAQNASHAPLRVVTASSTQALEVTDASGANGLKLFLDSGSSLGSIHSISSVRVVFRGAAMWDFGNPVVWSAATDLNQGIDRHASGVLKVTNGSSGLGSLIVGAASAANAPLTVRGAVSQSGNLVEWQSSASAVYGTISENGYFTTRKTSAPADAELAAGEMALWFDSTNGAAKLMVKAKQADGTVRTGSLALT